MMLNNLVLNNINGLAIRIGDFFFQHGNFFAFLTILLFFFQVKLSFRIIKLSLNKLKQKREGIKKYFLFLSLLLLLVTALYWGVVSQRIFFSYEETDLKFFISAIEHAKHDEYLPVGTPRGGYGYVFTFLFRVFPSLMRPENLFRFIIISNFFVVLLTAFLIYHLAYEWGSSSGLISFLVALTLILFRQYVSGIWIYKLFYMLPLSVLFLSYFVFLHIRELFNSGERFLKENFKKKLIALFLFFINVYLMIYSRPEFLFLVAPMIFYVLFYVYREIRVVSIRRKILYIVMVLTLLVLLNLDVFAWFVYEPARRKETGMIQPLTFSHLANLRDPLIVCDWISYLSIFVLLFSRSTFLFGLIYGILFTYYRLSPFLWDAHLLPMYFIFVMFLVLKHFVLPLGRRTALSLLITLLAIFLFFSPIYPFERPYFFSDKGFFDNNGADILYVKHYLKDKDYIIYEKWPRVFSVFVFQDSPSEFRGFREYLAPNMSLFFRNGYLLRNVSSSFFTHEEKPVVFSSFEDYSSYTIYLNDSIMKFSKLLNKTKYYNLYKPYFIPLSNSTTS